MKPIQLKIGAISLKVEMYSRQAFEKVDVINNVGKRVEIKE